MCECKKEFENELQKLKTELIQYCEDTYVLRGSVSYKRRIANLSEKEIAELWSDLEPQ